MRLKTILFAGAVALSITNVKAQGWVEDTITMGPGYGNDVFYSMKNDEAKVSQNNDWHIAFQMTPPGPYGNVSIIANHVQGGVKVYSTHLQASTNFTAVIDSTGYTGSNKELYNSDESWNFGAFNQMASSSNPFDYSWGMYDLNTHEVNGDSLYLVAIPNAVYKVWVQRYDSAPADSVHYRFRIAKIDGSEDTTIKIYRKPNYTDRLFAYYNIATKTVIDREPSRAAWDILFTRYIEYIMPNMPYPVMGVLSNFDVTVAHKYPVLENDTLGYAGYGYSDILKATGSNWKTFDNTTMQWTLADSNYYFIKTKNTGEYYQLQFQGFGGSGNGKVMFRKRYLGVYNPLSVATANAPLSTYKLVPNPAANDVSILIDTKEAVDNARLMVTDFTGRLVYNNVVNVKNGLNAYTINTSALAAGAYIVTLTNGSWKVAEKLVVQH